MSHPTKPRLIKLAVGVALFAALMALQFEVQGPWLRAMVAGCAFGVLAWSIVVVPRK